MWNLELQWGEAATYGTSSAGFDIASDITDLRHECADRDIFLKATGLAGLSDMQ